MRQVALLLLLLNACDERRETVCWNEYEKPCGWSCGPVVRTCCQPRRLPAGLDGTWEPTGPASCTPTIVGKP